MFSRRQSRLGKHLLLSDNSSHQHNDVTTPPSVVYSESDVEDIIARGNAGDQNGIMVTDKFGLQHLSTIMSLDSSGMELP